MPPRKKRNLKKAKTEAIAGREDSDATSSRKTLRGRRGSLANLPDMPLDIVLEVFSHLLPPDLLNLARTTKPFRALLMSRSSENVLWRASRKHVDGLPDCPPFLSEPAYANFMFGAHCDLCGKSTTALPCFTLVIKCCATCQKSKFRDYRDPYEFNQRLRSRYKYVRIEFDSVTHALGSEDLPCFKHSAYLVSDYEKLMNEIIDITDLRELDRVLEDRRRMVEERAEFGEKCSPWFKAQKQSQMDNLDQKRKKRLDSVISRLCELGYEADLAWIADMDYRPISLLSSVRQARELTDRGWDNMQDEVIAAIETVRAKRIPYEHEHLLRKRLRILFDAFNAEIPRSRPGRAGTSLIPTFYDIAKWPSINAIINADDAVNVTLDTFIASRTMGEHIEDWCIEAETQLAKTVRSLLDIPDNVNPFDLACTVLSCKQCGMYSGPAVLYHPEIIHHQCFHRHYNNYSQTLMLESICYSLDRDASLWSPDQLCLSEQCKVAREVIIACGQDPKTATVRQMDALDVRLSCKACQLSNPNICIALTWRAAITHLLKTCIAKKPKEENWTRLPPKMLAQAKDVEKMASEYYQKKHDNNSHWWCAHCNIEIRSHWAPKHETWRHLNTVHGIETPSDADAYASTPYLNSPVWLISNKLSKDDLDPHAYPLKSADLACVGFCDLSSNSE